MVETQFKPQLETYDITSESSFEFEAVPVIPAHRLDEIMSVAQQVPNIEFCLPQIGCVQTIKAGEEVLLFPQKSTLIENLSNNFSQTDSSDLKTEVEVDKNVMEIGAYVDSILQNPEEFRRLKARTVHVNHESALYAGIPPKDSLKIAADIAHMFDRVQELSRKNGSSTIEEYDEYKELVGELPKLIINTVRRNAVLEEIKSSVVAD